MGFLPFSSFLFPFPIVTSFLIVFDSFIQTHALSLRRAVLGRSKSFDELLTDHRAAKEEFLRAKAAANGTPFVPKHPSNKHGEKKSSQHHDKVPKVNGVGPAAVAVSDKLSPSFQPAVQVAVPSSPAVAHPAALSPSHKLLSKPTKLSSNCHLQR